MAAADPARATAWIAVGPTPTRTSRAQGPRGPVLVWVAVDPHSEVVEFGPDIRPARAGAPDRCPLYVVVDAVSGRGYGAWQSCDPPYRG
jgi:hypothetical protein